MQPIYKGILALIRSVITEEKIELPDGFSLEAACSTIKSQQVENLIYIGALQNGFSGQLPVMKELFQRNCLYVHQDYKQQKALKLLFEAFEKNGIDYMPVKGCNMKALYPRSDMRAMCDADVLIRMEQYESIKQIMLQLGYTEGIESGHELHWHSPLLHLELHKWLMHPEHVDFFKYLTDCWEYAYVKEGHRYLLKPEDEWIYMFIHYAKHYRMGGIGVRQVLDLWIWRRRYSMDMAYIREEIAKINLLEFLDNTLRLIDVWFADRQTDEITEFMTESIFAGGSWGTPESFDIALANLSMARSGSLKAGRRKQLCSMIFPGPKLMQNRYKVVRKAPWLTPVFWPVRWIGAIFFRRDNIRRNSKRLQNTTDENVLLFREALEYVGMKSDFDGKA